MQEFVKYIPYIVVVLLVGGMAIYNLVKRPEKIKEWLVWACAQAEIELGSGTGQLKLRAVYDMFMKQFPVMQLFISFERFSGWVELALLQLEDWIENNPSLAFAVKGEEIEIEEEEGE